MGQLDDESRRNLGQFFTPAPVAALMASWMSAGRRKIRLLEPGAGAGSLIGAAVEELCSRAILPLQVSVTAVEVDENLVDTLAATLTDCREMCERVGIRFESEVVRADFLEWAGRILDRQITFEEIRRPSFDVVILNPPYKKIASNSRERSDLSRIGLETANLYSAFLGVSALLLADGGELIAITPRSFCNGAYFREFRRLFLDQVTFTRVHIVDSRREAFVQDGVLQENVMFRAVKGQLPGRVVVTTGGAGLESHKYGREVGYAEIVSPHDPDQFIHLSPEMGDNEVAEFIRRQPSNLCDLNLTVSTGRVVDFRARDHLRSTPESGSVPLIYPTHCSVAGVAWPKQTKKPNAIMAGPDTTNLLIPAGCYVLVKRFSAKEERRRVTATVCDTRKLGAPAMIGIENHLNYFHEAGNGLAPDVAAGLAAYLNSTSVDKFFRQFSGHTQVNAGDLRKIRYPNLHTIRKLGRAVRRKRCTDQQKLDELVTTLLRQD